MTMEPDSTLLRRFPLVARPRPIAGPLAARVDDLCALAERAAREHDRAAASAVYNQAALLASDCGQPDLARRWCHEHAAAYLQAVPLDARAARHALEPMVNLARLHIRDRDGEAALHLLTSLFEAVSSRTDGVIDGQALPASRLTRSEDDHREVRQWLWSVLVAEGVRALAGAGRWREAYAHLERHRGIGQRMLDGRQVAVIAHVRAGDLESARALVAGTARGEPWEEVITACLAYLCDRPSRTHLDLALEGYLGLRPAQGLAVFETRLGLTLIDASTGADQRILPKLVSEVVARAVGSGDAYAAREVLLHEGLMAAVDGRHTTQLRNTVSASGLILISLPVWSRERIDGILDACRAPIAEAW
ncbi:hypothetical protein [Micromonospora sp. WMMA1976]|uniref:hypothetical protein n=1 Tax=Micromonospora sp. WMMA1976 TaxID=3014995 RepID=UPI00248CCF7F|nr:hypothetical protein [Micromonospora sp. WMMA1976]WBC05315.1 hypothetical protein O7546_10260 [Micromonospora sp. WMMA1976]